MYTANPTSPCLPQLANAVCCSVRVRITKAKSQAHFSHPNIPFSSHSIYVRPTYQMEYDDSGSELGDGDALGKGSPLMIKDYRVTGDHIDLREFYFSNEEDYRKLEELKRSHLGTMAELESIYRKKLELKGVVPLNDVEGAHRFVHLLSLICLG